jgi:DNA polymerase-4
MTADLILDRDCLDPEQRHRAVLALAEQLGQRLRSESRVTGRVTLTVRYADRSSTIRTSTLAEPTAHSPRAAGRPWTAAGTGSRLRDPHRRPAAGERRSPSTLPGPRRRPGPRRGSRRRLCPPPLRPGRRTLRHFGATKSGTRPRCRQAAAGPRTSRSHQ